MALTTDQQTMRDAVRRSADVVEFTEKHPDTRINDLLNQGLGALSRVCRTTNPEFQPVGSSTITFDGTETVWPLPSNFRSLLSVEYAGDSGYKSWLNPFELHERAALSDPDTTSTATRAEGYRLQGSNIEFLPRPPDGHTALLWYATTVTQLASNAATFDTMERLDTYVIWWAAREIAADRENWQRHDRLAAKLSELEADIRILARSKDLSMPKRIVDTRIAGRNVRLARTRGRW